MDPSVVDKGPDMTVMIPVLLAEIVSQAEQKLTTQYFISMNITNVFDLWFICKRVNGN